MPAIAVNIHRCLPNSFTTAQAVLGEIQLQRHVVLIVSR